MRSIVSTLGAQFIIENSNHEPFASLVTRGAPPFPGGFGPVTLVQDPSENLSGAIFEGLDYEAIYILDSSIFGAGDFGRLTTRGVFSRSVYRGRVERSNCASRTR
jgi:hypothetical protein